MLLLLLCGCAKGKTADVTKEMRESGGFTAHATVHYLDKEYGFTVEKDPETIRQATALAKAGNYQQALDTLNKGGSHGGSGK